MVSKQNLAILLIKRVHASKNEADESENVGNDHHEQKRMRALRSVSIIVPEKNRPNGGDKQRALGESE